MAEQNLIVSDNAPSHSYGVNEIIPVDSSHAESRQPSAFKQVIRGAQQPANLQPFNVKPAQMPQTKKMSATPIIEVSEEYCSLYNQLDLLRNVAQPVAPIAEMTEEYRNLCKQIGEIPEGGQTIEKASEMSEEFRKLNKKIQAIPTAEPYKPLTKNQQRLKNTNRTSASFRPEECMIGRIDGLQFLEPGMYINKKATPRAKHSSSIMPLAIPEIEKNKQTATGPMHSNNKLLPGFDVLSTFNPPRLINKDQQNTQEQGSEKTNSRIWKFKQNY